MAANTNERKLSRHPDLNRILLELEAMTPEERDEVIRFARESPDLRSEGMRRFIGHLEELCEYWRYNEYPITVTCRCGHTAEVEATALTEESIRAEESGNLCLACEFAGKALEALDAGDIPATQSALVQWVQVVAYCQDDRIHALRALLTSAGCRANAG